MFHCYHWSWAYCWKVFLLEFRRNSWSHFIFLNRFYSSNSSIRYNLMVTNWVVFSIFFLFFFMRGFFVIFYLFNFYFVVRLGVIFKSLKFTDFLILTDITCLDIICNSQSIHWRFTETITNIINTESIFERLLCV